MSLLIFFFSSRRRHTRSLRDWSSDVCSSDLGEVACASRTTTAIRAEPRIAVVVRDAQATSPSGSNDILTLPIHNYGDQIGRASCRKECNSRGWWYNKKEKTN